MQVAMFLPRSELTASFPSACRSVHNARHAERVQSAWKTAAGCDALLFVVDAHRQLQAPDPRVIQVAEKLEENMQAIGLSAAPPVALVLNKADAVPKEQRPSLLKLADAFRGIASFEGVFWISALRGQGVEDIRQYLLSCAVPGEWAVEAGEGTDASKADIACEIVREKIFRAYYKGKEVL